MSVAKLVIQHLITTEEYGKKVFPYLSSDYFRERTDKVLFDIISDYVKKYTAIPSISAIAIELSEMDGIDEIEFDEAKAFLSDVEKEDVNLDWLVDKTEEFCKQAAIQNAILTATEILADDKKAATQRDSIPGLLQQALAISFNEDIGHDYLEDWEARFDHYHDHAVRIPFHIEYLNKITGGGLPPKTLSVVLAGTGVGKSLIMCDLAARNMMDNKNVLYITMELSKEMVSERIDANLMDLDLDLMGTVSKETFKKKIQTLAGKTTGKLIVQEYPTSSAGAAHFRFLLNELKLKRGFVPDIIYIDYINICMSTRYGAKGGAGQNSYTIIKMVAEEFRGLAVSFNVPIVTATQTNRGGFTSTDLGLEDTAESFGLPATADFMISMTQDDEMKLMRQVRFKQLKNRFRDVERDKKFDMGIDKPKMRIFELEAGAQKALNNDSQVPLPKKKDKLTPATKGKGKYGGFT